MTTPHTPHPKGETVHELFTSMLGTAPRDRHFYDCPVDSACGEDCEKAIKAAAKLIGCLRMALGTGTAEEVAIRNVCEVTCNVYYCA